MKRGAIALSAVLLLCGADYRPDFDFPGRGDDWYGRFLPDPRRDFGPAHPVDRASDGDDFGRGYSPLAAFPGFGPPLERTDGPGSAYRYFNDSTESFGGDCDANGILDVDQLAAAAGGCHYPLRLVQNDTTTADATYLGPPDDVYFGIGGQIVTWEVGCGTVVDGPGGDLTLFEVDTGGPEFTAFDLLVSEDGVHFVSIKSAELPPLPVPGDGAHGSATFSRSYDIAVSGFDAVRYIRIDGNGTGASGTGTGFDLDALGLVHVATDDCDANGTIDACDAIEDCNGNGIPESCELALGSIDDCDSSGTADTCDTLGGANDCDGDTVPDVCEPDCNANATPDDCDLAAMTSGDCNGNGVPDECDLALTSVTIEPAEAARSRMLVFAEGFETPDTNNFITYGAGQSIVTSAATWDVVVTGVDLYEAAARPEASAFEGAQAIDLTGSPGAGVIETTLATTAGEAYELVFRYARNDLLGPTPGQATVEVTGASTLLEATVVHDPAEHPFNTWLEFRGPFVADGASTVLRFTSLNPGNTGVTLDGIELYLSTLTGYGLAAGSGFVGSASVPTPFPAAGDVTALMSASTDLGASNEYLDLGVNGVPLARFFELDGQQCALSQATRTIPAEAFNVAAASANPASIDILPPSSVNGFECADAFAAPTLVYEPIVDCNANGVLDQCDIAAMTSNDVDADGIADECEADCNGNGLPDGYEVEQMLVPDCNANGVPDSCDVASATSDDCDTNGIPDECETDCNANGVNDVCDLATMTSDDCDANGVPDECDLAAGAGGCAFPDGLLDNGTTGDDALFLGPPDDQFWGLGGQIVTYEFSCGFVANGPGPDFTIYEVDTGSPEFPSIDDVLVSADGVTFVSVHATESPGVAIPGDEMHGSENYTRSYDIDATGLNAVRFVRIDGVGTGASGSGTGFDLDAIGAIHRADVDCDMSGVLDRCETFDDCNANGYPDSCEEAIAPSGDCDGNGTLDTCDVAGGAPDVDFDWIPDGCEADCDGNMVPDHHEIEIGDVPDCNDNLVPDACDLAAMTSADCNTDGVPDECPVCPTVEVVIIIDVSSSMTDEASALCASVNQIVSQLQFDLVDVDVEILGILGTGGATFSCVNDTVDNLYGVAVPGNPPAGQETLGEPCGVHLNEDWGPATSIVAGLKPWQADSVRLIVPISDEGPRCGDPSSDPGEDRDAINHAIGIARDFDVVVSPIAGTGSGAGLLTLMQAIADATDGQVFSSTEPDADLADGLLDTIEAACSTRSDCNMNGTPDDCDLVDMTSNDCDMSGRPDECENDCNANGLEDSCDIANMTSDDTNGNAVPDECEGLVLTSDGVDWSWTAVPGAIGYDLVRGSLGTLLGSVGDFAAATEACLVNDTVGTSWPVGPGPAPGAGYWYLVRGETGTVELSYDSGGAGQVASRDAGIAASGVACP